MKPVKKIVKTLTAAAIDYGDLGVELPTHYYVENGEYVKQAPDHVDTRGKFMLLNFDHFSRYAVAWSN